jgi:polyisoprenoid-binding protein YceI
MKTFSRIAVPALMLALAVPALAAPKTFVIDKSHSNVAFTIRHLFSKVTGRFDDFSGTVAYDADNLAASKVDVVIKSASIYTAQARRDAHLKSADFFNADSFPELAFHSTEVKKVGDRVSVTGNLTIRGITHPVVLDAAILGVGPGMGGRETAGFEGKTRINRKDYNVLWNKALDKGGMLLGDDVDIDISVEAGEAAPAAPAGK